MAAWIKTEGYPRMLTRRLAWWLLSLFEYVLLWSYGWRRTNRPRNAEDAWKPPTWHSKNKEQYGRTHAVNSTRYYVRPVKPRRPQRRKEQGFCEMGDQPW